MFSLSLLNSQYLKEISSIVLEIILLACSEGIVTDPFYLCVCVCKVVVNLKLNW